MVLPSEHAGGAPKERVASGPVRVPVLLVVEVEVPEGLGWSEAVRGAVEFAAEAAKDGTVSIDAIPVPARVLAGGEKLVAAVKGWLEQVAKKVVS